MLTEFNGIDKKDYGQEVRKVQSTFSDDDRFKKDI
jgi:hypothetical protein